MKGYNSYLIFVTMILSTSAFGMENFNALLGGPIFGNANNYQGLNIQASYPTQDGGAFGIQVQRPSVVQQRLQAVDAVQKLHEVEIKEKESKSKLEDAKLNGNIKQSLMGMLVGAAAGFVMERTKSYVARQNGPKKWVNTALFFVSPLYAFWATKALNINQTWDLSPATPAMVLSGMTSYFAFDHFLKK